MRTLALALVLLLAGCSEKEPPIVLDQPPSLVVTVGNTRIEVPPESYDWTGREGRVIADSAPPEILLGNLKPTAVPAGRPAELSLVLPPNPGSLTAHLWQQPDYSRTPVPLTQGNRLSLPDKPGIYTYSVEAKWSQGEASYIFQISVR